MANARINLKFYSGSQSNNDPVSSKQSKGVNTNSFTQATAANQPRFKTSENTNANTNNILPSTACDGGDFMSLAASETIPSSTAYSMIFAWVGGDYTNDTWLVSSSSNDAHYGIDAGGNGIIAKPNGSKAASAERDVPTNNTDNSTVSYSFGSDVEMLVVVNHGDLNVDFYNIDGDKIGALVSSAGMNQSFPVDHVLGKSDGTLGLNGEILDIVIIGGEALTADACKARGNMYKQLKD